MLGRVLTADISEASCAGRLVRSLFSFLASILLLTAPGHGGARAVSTSMAACMRTRGRCRFARATLREAGQRVLVVAAMIWMVRRAGTISGFEKRRFALSGQGKPGTSPLYFPSLNGNETWGHLCSRRTCRLSEIYSTFCHMLLTWNVLSAFGANGFGSAGSADETLATLATLANTR